MKNEEWLIVDTETNGLYPPICTVEIAAQRMVGWEPAGEPFRMLLNHDVPIDPMAEAIHGYSREYLRRHGEDPVQVHSAFHAYASDLPIVAYNVSFDWGRVLQPEYARLRVPVTGCKGFCAMTLARRVVTETRNYKLETLKEHFQLGDQPSHRALNDVWVVTRLFQQVFRDRLVGAGVEGFINVAEFSRRTPVARCQEEIQRAAGEPPVWYVALDGDQRAGPFRVRQVLDMASGEPCYVWREGMIDWANSAELPEFNTTTAKPKARKPRKPRGPKRDTPQIVDAHQHLAEVKAYGNELLGLCRGIVADGQLNEREIVALQEWLASCPFTHIYPMNAVADTLERVCEDGIVTTAEQAELISVLNSVLDSGR